jgi:hypothetical protein
VPVGEGDPGALGLEEAYVRVVAPAHEHANRPLKPEQVVPENCSWQRLSDAASDDLEVTYRHTSSKTLANYLGHWRHLP